MIGVQVSVCGMLYKDLNNYTLKILGTRFGYNKKLKEEKKFKAVIDIQWVVEMRNLRTEGKIVIFKTTVISKNAFRSFITTFQNILW